MRRLHTVPSGVKSRVLPCGQKVIESNGSTRSAALRSTPVSSAVSGAPSPRSGKLLIQVVVYMTILSSLLGLGAMCLHAAFRADEGDVRDSLLLRSLVRCEKQLRDDNRTQAMQVDSSEKMSLPLSDDRQIVWQSHRGVLTRQVLKSGILVSTDRFPFPAGTSIEFLNRNDGFVIARIQEPSPVVVYAQTGEGSTHPTKPEEVAMPSLPDGVARARFIDIVLRGAL